MNTKLIEWVLRISVAGEFIGHGVFALQGKKDWIGWFAKFGVSDPGTATRIELKGFEEAKRWDARSASH